MAPKRIQKANRWNGIPPSYATRDATGKNKNKVHLWIGSPVQIGGLWAGDPCEMLGQISLSEFRDLTPEGLYLHPGESVPLCEE